MPNRPEPAFGDILTREQAVVRANEWRNADEKIVLTNGCFDLLHVGHVTYLAQAKALGTKLIVGLNSDRSVRAIKGPSRPLNTQDSRAAVLAALRAVDAIVIFDEDTPIELIRALKPHVHTKGGDYSPDTLPEYDVTRSLGGDTIILPFVDGFSTTDLIKRL
ncbi:MAG: D-glycero-beta-D-manno-heptose 1-phosphate adenylyltransferase [bacterium]|nr:D-glycero-beta-D-manno-heptose 1-phosphate adenylyltransferase [bacterium]